MAFVELEQEPSAAEGLYPRFDEIGDFVEGNISGFIVDDYNNKRIELWKEIDGEDSYQILPSHADLKKYYNKLQVGDYVRIELKKIIPSTNPEYNDKKIYKVLVDKERFLEFE